MGSQIHSRLQGLTLSRSIRGAYGYQEEDQALAAEGQCSLIPIQGNKIRCLSSKLTATAVHHRGLGWQCGNERGLKTEDLGATAISALRRAILGLVYDTLQSPFSAIDQVPNSWPTVLVHATSIRTPKVEQLPCSSRFP
jgi:hypothetical protein